MYVSCSVMSDSATSWTLPRQAPLSMEFSRQEYWSGLTFPSPMHESEEWKWRMERIHSSGDPPNPGIEPGSPVLQADSLWSESLLLSCFSRVWLCATPETAATRLPCPWDSPGKNTGVGCHFLLQCMKVKSESEVAQSCPTLSDPMDCSLPGSSIHGIFQVWITSYSENINSMNKVIHMKNFN